MKRIQLGGHKKNNIIRGYALVDDEDFEKLSKYRWSIHKCRNKFYANCYINGKITYMHRFILETPKKMYTDHINGNTLNNQKSNLRICTNAENLRNRGISKVNVSGYKGISLHKQTGKYRVRINVSYKEIHLGLFEKIEEARKAQIEGLLKYHKEFAFL